MNTAQRNQFLFIWKNVSDPGFLLSHIIKLPYFFFKYPGPVAKALMMLPQALAKRAAEKKVWQKRDKEILKLWTR